MIQSQQPRVTFPANTRKYSDPGNVREIAKLKFTSRSQVDQFLKNRGLNNPIQTKTVKNNATEGVEIYYLVEVTPDDVPNDTSLNFVQRQIQKSGTDWLMLLNANTHMTDIEYGRNGAVGASYFAYPTSDTQSLPAYLDSVPGVQNCQRAMETHTATHIHNRSSLGHGLILQAALDMMLVASQTNIQNISRIIQIIAGSISMIARKDIKKMEQENQIPEGNYHDGFKLNFSAYFVLLLADLKQIDKQSHAYTRVQEAVKDVNRRAELRSKYGENLTTMTDTAAIVVSRWDPELLRNYGNFDREVIENQLPTIMGLFYQSIEKMCTEFESIQNKARTN